MTTTPGRRRFLVLGASLLAPTAGCLGGDTTAFRGPFSEDGRYRFSCPVVNSGGSKDLAVTEAFPGLRAAIRPGGVTFARLSG